MAGRRQRRQQGGRRRQIQVRVSAETGAVLDRRAAAAEVSVPRLLVESALADEVHGTRRARQALADRLEVVEVRCARIGGNLNQLAARVNSMGEVEPGALAAVLAYHRTTLQELQTLLDRVR